MSQQAIADELGVTRKTISNLLSPNAGFGSGVVMLRYLQLAGAVSYAPERGDSLLQRLLATVTESANQTAASLEAIEKLLAGLDARLSIEGAQAQRAAKR
jgi:transcriptional regulator with XRE-family HTH domain